MPLQEIAITRRPTKDHSTIVLKFLFVVLCCTTAAVVAAFFHKVYQGVPSILLLATVTASAFWLGMRGKISQSWAVLAYGSWMTIPCLMVLSLVWNEPFAAGADRVSCVLYGIGIVFFTWIGIRAALRSDWTRVGLWWLLTLFLFFILGTFWFWAIEVYPQQPLYRDR